MHKYVFFLKCSSIVVKVAAWIFLLLGLIGSISVFSGAVPNNPRWIGLVILGFYSFVFLVLFLIGKIADILAKVIKTIDKV
jgi:hypothetical protein